MPKPMRIGSAAWAAPAASAAATINPSNRKPRIVSPTLIVAASFEQSAGDFNEYHAARSAMRWCAGERNTHVAAQLTVMLGLDPSIHVFARARRLVDRRGSSGQARG